MEQTEVDAEGGGGIGHAAVHQPLLGQLEALALATQGQPADMPQEMWWFFWAAAAWMPIVGVLLPGMLPG